MSEAIISTHAVRPTPDGQSVEVIASLDAGEVVPGMHLHIPLNSMLDLTIPIAEVAREIEGRLRLLLACEDGEADIILAFNFADETLWVKEAGEG